VERPRGIMDFNYLPEKIKKALGAEIREKIPVSILRTNGNLDGEPGEGYMLAYDDKVMLFSRSIGDDDYQEFDLSYRDGVSDIRIKKEKFNSFLEINSDKQNYSLKFSSFEEDQVKPLVELWNSVSGTGAEATPPPLPVETEDTSETPPKPVATISPMSMLSAALMYLATSDESIDKAEDEYIKKVCSYSPDDLKAGFDYYRSHKFEDLQKEFQTLDRQQKLCILANLLELGMADGVLHRQEQEFIRQFCSFADLSEDEYETIREVLLLKNQISVML
jgi:hypothetical protein